MRKTLDAYPDITISDRGIVRINGNRIAVHKSSGYPQVRIRDAFGKHKLVLVHKLVALAFLDRPEGDYVVDHIDGDRSNNDVYNLQYLTRVENSSKKLTCVTLTLHWTELDLTATFKSITQCAEIFGITQQALGIALKQGRLPKALEGWTFISKNMSGKV